MFEATRSVVNCHYHNRDLTQLPAFLSSGIWLSYYFLLHIFVKVPKFSLPPSPLSSSLRIPLLICSSHAIRFSCVKCIIQWILLYAQSHATITTITSRIFSSPQRETLHHLAVIPFLPISSGPRRPPVYVLSRWIDLLWTFISGCVFFCDWLLFLA